MTPTRTTRWRSRSLALLLSFAMVGAACGDSGGDDDEPSAAPGDEAGEADSTTDPTETGDQAPDPDEPLVPVSGGTLQYGVAGGGIGSGFDTTSAILPDAAFIIQAITDPLVGITPDGGWAPLLAESLEPNDDATVWTLTLREGVTFHDGEVLDAAAAKANIEAVKGGPTVGFALSDLDTVEVIDPLTLELTMGRPWAAFPYVLSGQPGWMVSPSTIGTNDDFVSVGPFMVESIVQNDSVKLVRNPDYWRADEGLPYLDGVNFKEILDPGAITNALENGQIDIHTTAGSELQAFMERPGFDGYRSDGEVTDTLIILNTTSPPLDDVRVRRALAAALDRQFLIDVSPAGVGRPAGSFLSPNHRYWVETDYPSFDPALAADLIAEYEAEFGDVRFSFTVPTVFVAEMEVLVSFWDDVGAEVEIEEVLIDDLVNVGVGDQFQTLWWSQFGAPDPDSEYLFFHSSSGPLNWSNLVDPGLDDAFDRGRTSLAEEDRAEAYADVQERLASEVPMLWLGHGDAGAIFREQVQGIDRATFADGSARAPMVNGSSHSFGELWLTE